MWLFKNFIPLVSSKIRIKIKIYKNKDKNPIYKDLQKEQLRTAFQFNENNVSIKCIVYVVKAFVTDRFQ